MMYKTAKEDDTEKSLQQLMDENLANKEAYYNDSKVKSALITAPSSL